MLCRHWSWGSSVTVGGQSSTWPGLAKKNQLSCSKESQASDRRAYGQALKSFFPLFITVQKDPGDSFCGDAVTLCPLSQESEGRLCPKSILTDSGINSWSSVHGDSPGKNTGVGSRALLQDESRHTRPPCPSLTPGVHSDSRPSSQ